MLSYSLGERNILNPAHDVSLLEEYLLTLPKGKKVVFIDEVSWMDTQKSGLVTILSIFGMDGPLLAKISC